MNLSQTKSLSISIIVPAYNIERYIGECLDSLINQTYQNLEILVINDGSTDRTGEILDSYAVKDDRIRVLHKTNGGLSSTRNLGLDIATGDLISFIDGDDLVDLGLYQTVVNYFEQYPEMDILQFGFKTFVDGTAIQPDKKSNQLVVIEHKTALLQFVCAINFQGIVCNKIYSKNILKEIRFYEGKFYEDGPFSLETFYRNRGDVGFTTDKFYYYRRDREGAITQKFTRRLFDEYEILSDLQRKYKNDKKFDIYLKNYAIEHLINLYNDVLHSNTENKKEILKIARNTLKRYKQTTLLSSGMKKIRYRIFLFSPKMYGCLASIMKKIK